MSDDPRRLETQDALDRLNLARRRGGLCAACGKALAPEEVVYWEPVEVDIDRSDLGLGHYTAAPEAPVGAECASPAILDKASARPPERCAGCGRGVYYRVPRLSRRRAVCCRNCRYRTVTAERAGKG